MYVNAFNLYLLFIYLEDILHTDLIYKIIDIEYFSYHVTRYSCTFPKFHIRFQQRKKVDILCSVV